MKTKEENKCPKCGATCETGRANVLGELRNSQILKCTNCEWFTIIPPEHEPQAGKETETMDASKYECVRSSKCPKCHRNEIRITVSPGPPSNVTISCTHCDYTLNAPADELFDLVNAWNNGE